MRKDRLELIMNKRGHNPKSLSEMIGVSERNLWRLLSGTGSTTDHTVVQIAQALDVSADYLLGLSDDPNNHLKIDNMSDEEKSVLIALRRGEKLRAIEIIAASK